MSYAITEINNESVHGVCLIKIDEKTKKYDQITEIFSGETKEEAIEKLISEITRQIKELKYVSTDLSIEPYRLIDAGNAGTLKIKICKTCGREFLLDNDYAKFCPRCVNLNNVYMNNKEVKTCKKCGKLFTSMNHEKLCKECKQFANTAPYAIDCGFSNHDCCSHYKCPICGTFFTSYDYDSITKKAPCGHTLKTH